MNPSSPSRARWRTATLAAAAAAFALPGVAHAATPAELLSAFAGRAGTAPQPARGQQLFTTRHGREWSCASCHGTPPTQAGRHASTGKPIAALAPAANGERFTDPAKAEKWFRRNCNDVIGRECTDVEKADVLAWLVGLQP
jgi:mono/diheme cytochrome c family protein